MYIILGFWGIYLFLIEYINLIVLLSVFCHTWWHKGMKLKKIMRKHTYFLLNEYFLEKNNEYVLLFE